MGFLIADYFVISYSDFLRCHHDPAFLPVACNSVFQDLMDPILPEGFFILLVNDLPQCLLAFLFLASRFRILYLYHNSEIGIINPNGNITESVS